MTQSHSMRSIALSLSIDDPFGMRIGKFGGTGRVEMFAFPRERLNDFLDMEKNDFAGVYFLVEESDDRSITGRDGTVYVGSSENIFQRLQVQRTKEKNNFWKDTIVIRSNTRDGFRPAHIRFLEKFNIDEVKQAGRYSLENKQDVTINSAYKELEFQSREFFEEIRILIPALGFRFFTPFKYDTFYCSGKGADGIMRRTSEGYVVEKGSIASREVTDDKEAQKIRSSLLATGDLVKEGDGFVFARSVPFKSPSAAGRALLGRACSGKTEWRRSDGKTLKDLERS